MCLTLTYTFKLDTDRLYLEPLAATDLPILHSFLTDESVRQYLFDNQIVPISQSAEILETALDTFSTHGYGLWLIYLKDSLEMIGFVGCILFSPNHSLSCYMRYCPHMRKKAMLRKLLNALLAMPLKN
ncbi:GNAT family N-acetyltransferase [Rhodocytophaga rosea]|uniref:GNAT family N-acetyltransferase n=1 Tax=Rhodocytophaga rosea TaxID=2704465 RepID=A0A6C0GLA2_9BACT|nr:GNAT family N-acetyltransferase [Rhodocytophaga rosea]QHT68788.1 GNAT family N-acetyltransferase [Rhodocytophaga rosea]